MKGSSSKRLDMISLIRSLMSTEIQYLSNGDKRNEF
ncbi:unnamed protein product [Brugia timori]|uniref:Uncharacterized protein n=1 Tax=Brugia timori TaxID=42155 RepID=A0A0R3R5Y4_9BILA|nr:unnamed protein product [Brugia timori]